MSNSNFDHISKVISKKQVSNQLINKVKNHYFRIRKRLAKEIELDSIKFDTLYLLESYEYENGRTYGSLKIDHKIVNFSFFQDSFSFSKEPYFPEIMIDDAFNWNFSIDERGVEELYPSQNVYLSRVIGNRGNFSIDVRLFKLYDKVPGD